MIKAIETQYKGYRFRSRTEARWAVFFDAVGAVWEYEKEGYDLGEAGLYLPDFWLPDLGLWVEIKGGDPTPDELRKAAALCEATEYPVVIFAGAPWFNIARAYFVPTPGGAVDVANYCSGDEYDYERTNGEGCFYQGWHTFGVACSRHWGYKPRLTVIVLVEYPDTWHASAQEIVRAYVAARSVRFEHGESPR